MVIVHCTSSHCNLSTNQQLSYLPDTVPDGRKDKGATIGSPFGSIIIQYVYTNTCSICLSSHNPDF